MLRKSGITQLRHAPAIQSLLPLQYAPGTDGVLLHQGVAIVRAPKHRRCRRIDDGIRAEHERAAFSRPRKNRRRYRPGRQVHPDPHRRRRNGITGKHRQCALPGFRKVTLPDPVGGAEIARTFGVHRIRRDGHGRHQNRRGVRRHLPLHGSPLHRPLQLRAFGIQSTDALGHQYRQSRCCRQLGIQFAQQTRDRDRHRRQGTIGFGKARSQPMPTDRISRRQRFIRRPGHAGNRDQPVRRCRRMLTDRNGQKQNHGRQQQETDQQQRPLLHDRLAARPEARLQPTQCREIGPMLL